MKRTDTSEWPCTIAQSVNVLGDHWNLLIIRQACMGTRRFDDFQASLGIGRNILTRRLQQLDDDGLLESVPPLIVTICCGVAQRVLVTCTRYWRRWPHGATSGSSAPRARR